MEKLEGWDILNAVDWYAITNLGTGPGNPHTVVLRQGEYNGTGTDHVSLETAIENAYEDLQRKSTL